VQADFATTKALYASRLPHIPFSQRRRGDLIFYGIVCIQPTAPMPPFGAVAVEARGHVVTIDIDASARRRGLASAGGFWLRAGANGWWKAWIASGPVAG
jgi:hypothetical protein